MGRSVLGHEPAGAGKHHPGMVDRFELYAPQLGHELSPIQPDRLSHRACRRVASRPLHGLPSHRPVCCSSSRASPPAHEPRGSRRPDLRSISVMSGSMFRPARPRGQIHRRNRDDSVSSTNNIGVRVGAGNVYFSAVGMLLASQTGQEIRISGGDVVLQACSINSFGQVTTGTSPSILVASNATNANLDASGNVFTDARPCTRGNPPPAESVRRGPQQGRRNGWRFDLRPPFPRHRIGNN